jgi:hypothetical protein
LSNQGLIDGGVCRVHMSASVWVRGALSYDLLDPSLLDHQT